MVFVNGEPLPVYDLDTQESRFNRIAYMLKTQPMFLATNPKDLIDIDEKTNIIATDLFQEIKTDATNGSLDFKSFYGRIKDVYTTPIEIIVYTWLKNINNFDDYRDAIIMTFNAEFPALQIEDILKHTNYDQTENIHRFLVEQSKIEHELEAFSFVIPVVMHNKAIQKITFEIQFKLNVDLVEIFDQLKISREIPYANNGPDRHKIFQSFRTLGEDWELGDQNAVQFYVLNTKYPPVRFQEKFYSQGVIIISDKPGEATLAIETLIGAKTNVNELIERVFTSLQIAPSNILSTRQQSVSSIVNIPKQRFNKYLMGDIICNDPLVSSLCYVDESTKIGRVRSGITFFYQPVGADDKVTITFTETAVESKDFRKNNVFYPINSRYVRVRINKARDEALTKEIAAFIGKIFTSYNAKRESLAAEYKKFIPEFVELEDKAKKTRGKLGTRLHDLVPEIFVSGYARKCQRPPVIVDKVVEEFAGEIKGDLLYDLQGFKEVIRFPKTAEEGPQHWYGCEKGMYPGLRLNVLENAHEFPYLPCCYLQSHKEKKNFKNYYLDYDIKAEKSSNYILKTPKFLDKGEYGEIPTNLQLLFQMFSNTPTDFYRTGTKRSPQSFIEAVSIATGRAISVASITDVILAAARQNAYGTSVEVLKKGLVNTEEYLNPSIYYRALEEYCNCYIYIFTRNGNTGSIVHPLHKHVLLRYKRERRPVILLFEHLGSESDAAQYPQCEVILSEVNKIKTTLFKNDFADQIDDIFTGTIRYYAGLQEVQDIDPQILPSNIVAQGIDAIGKVRTLTVKFEGKEICLLTNPLPPLVMKEKSSYKNNDVKLIEKYIKAMNLAVINITPDRYIVRNQDWEYELPYKVITKSTLQTYNQNQRTARYLQEYIYYMYSTYIKTNTMNPNNINTFLRNYTIVKPNYTYPKIPRRFNLDGQYLENGKLIVQSLEMAQRLGYSIELFMRRNPRRLLEYSSLTLIQEYYLDKNDFTNDPNTVIFMNEEALRDWINEQSVEYPLFTVPTKDIKLFYLLLDGDVKLIQLAESFENAVYIAKIWNTDHYNSRSVLQDTESSYMYYVFEGPTQLKRVGRSDNKVLVWKEANILYYGAILSW